MHSEPSLGLQRGGGWRCFPASIHWGPLRTLTISVDGKRNISCDDFIVANLAVLWGAVLVDSLHLQDAVVDLALCHDSLVGRLFEGGSKLIDVLHLDMDHGPRTTHRKEEMVVKKGSHHPPTPPTGTDSGPKVRRVERPQDSRGGCCLSVLSSLPLRPLYLSLPRSSEMNPPQRGASPSLTFLVTEL